MAFVSVGLLLRRRPRFDTAVTAVVADVAFGDVGDSRVVGVVDNGRVYAVHISVVGKATAFPSAALIPNTAVAEAVVDAAVETHVRSPIPRVPDIYAVTPAPVTGSPQEAHLWWLNPCAGHPVIAGVVVVSPVAGYP